MEKDHYYTIEGNRPVFVERFCSALQTSGMKSSDLQRQASAICEEMYGLKISASQIAQYKTGRARPSMERLQAIAMALGVTADWLLGKGNINETAEQVYANLDDEEKRERFKKRFLQAMEMRGMRQADVLHSAASFCRRTYGIVLSRSQLSQYASGRAIPRFERLRAIAVALNVREDWLRGMDDTSMEPAQMCGVTQAELDKTIGRICALTPANFKKLNERLEELELLQEMQLLRESVCE